MRWPTEPLVRRTPTTSSSSRPGGSIRRHATPIWCTPTTARPRRRRCEREPVPVLISLMSWPPAMRRRIRQPASVKIMAIRLDRMRLRARIRRSWPPGTRCHDAISMRLSCGLKPTTAYWLRSGDTMDGFAAFTDLFIGKDPLQIANHVRVLETIGFQAGRYWPLEAALWDIIGKACGQPIATLFGGATDRLSRLRILRRAKEPGRASRRGAGGTRRPGSGPSRSGSGAQTRSRAWQPCGRPARPSAATSRSWWT